MKAESGIALSDTTEDKGGGNMDLAKSYDFFQPEKCKDTIHIIGCGSVGATVAECLARFGLTNFKLYDFDVVEPHNLANQIFTTDHLYKPKTESTLDILSRINPDIAKTARLYNEGYQGQRLNGYVFLCVDNIDLRRKIASDNKNNPYIKAMFDFRTRLVDAQHYAAAWDCPAMVESFLSTMNFSHEEAEAETPMSACKVALSVTPTVRTICYLGCVNFINYVKNGVGALKKMVLANPFSFELDVA